MYSYLLANKISASKIIISILAKEMYLKAAKTNLSCDKTKRTQ